MEFHSSTIQNKISEIKHLLHTDIVTARNETEQLLEIYQKYSTGLDLAELFRLKSLVESSDNNTGEAIKWYNKELKIREKINDLKGASDALNNIGSIYYGKGQLTKAKEYYHKSLLYRESIKDQRGIAGVSDNIGAVLFRLGMTAEAFSMHFNALKINREFADQQRIGISLQNIGLTYLSQGDYFNAISHFQEALSIAQSRNDRKNAIQLMINIGTSLIKQNKIVEAKKYYEECYAESNTIKYDYGLTLSLKNLAFIEHKQGNIKQAITYYTDCMRIAEQTDNRAEITTALSGIGMCYSLLKDNQQAMKYLHDALMMARKTGIKENIALVYNNLAETYEHIGDFKKSLEYYKKYITLHDELLNKETTKTISEIKTRYEVETKEKEAQLLKEKNETISIYARKLEVSNNSLNQFAHVASHDLREPLRMVSSYMELLERTMGDNITADQRLFITFAVDGAKRMDTLIHDLLRLAKVDANPNVEHVPLSTIVSEVKKNIEVLSKERNAEIITPDLPVIMADRTQITQLLQNIIGNGIKYNESPRPTIVVTYESNTAHAVFSIADNGIGIPAGYRERAFQVFQRLPTAQKYQGSGIGLAICKKIVDSMGGEITITDNAGGGTVFTITLPLSIVC